MRSLFIDCYLYTSLLWCHPRHDLCGYDTRSITFQFLRRLPWAHGRTGGLGGRDAMHDKSLSFTEDIYVPFISAKFSIPFVRFRPCVYCFTFLNLHIKKVACPGPCLPSYGPPDKSQAPPPPPRPHSRIWRGSVIWRATISYIRAKCPN